MQGEYRGDFTRDTFDPAKHFSRVLMQQGRVILDGNWNEQTSILLHYLRTLATDLIGPHWGPSGGGFKIDIRNDSNGQPVKFDFDIKPGRYYVDGILCENHQPVAYTEQADFPQRPAEKDKLKKDTSLVYLDVWERHITALQDSLIHEVALGAPDTATRAQVVQQVRVDNLTERSTLDTDPIKTLAKELIDAADDTIRKQKAEIYLIKLVDKLLQPQSRGMLRARARKMNKPDEPCAISPESSYRGTENHLYRVEIHKGGGASEATFKWSRDNSSIVFPIRSLASGKVTLDHLGRDIGGSLQVNDWVEIVDDALVLHGETGPLRQVETIDPVEMSVTLKDPGILTSYDENSANHPLLRRWDQQGGGLKDGVKLREGNGEDEEEWIALEDGIQIQFQAPSEPVAPPNTYRSGDYWLIPARVATGDVEWPKDQNEMAIPEPPHGIEHHYAPLCVITLGADGSVIANSIKDLRHVI